MPIINWKTTKEEDALVMEISDRFKKGLGQGVVIDAVCVQMDIVCVHLNICRLDLKGLAEASAVDFAHDMHGIRHHLDRKAVRLTDCFVPRFARSEDFEGTQQLQSAERTRSARRRRHEDHLRGCR